MKPQSVAKAAGRMRLLFFILALLTPGTLLAQAIVAAAYEAPSTAYGHGALKGGEYAALRITLADGSSQRIRLNGAVFEDTAPRLHDFDGDGNPEVVTVVSGFDDGARVQLFRLANGAVQPAGATAPIGTRHRWLAIAGIADFTGDGVDEIAYIDRPHLAKVLRLVTVDMDAGETRFAQLAEATGLTNHKLGTPRIEGGVRACPGASPVVVTADADWREVVETRLESERLISTPVAPYTGPESLAAQMVCR